MGQEKQKDLLNNNIFFDYSFETLDLNKDMEKIYEIINDEELYDEFDKNVKLTNLKNENYKRYTNIEIIKYKNLPQDFDEIVEEIINLYGYIDPKKVLHENLFDAGNTKILLDNIYRRIDRLTRMVKTTLKELTAKNDEKQKKFSIGYFKNLEIEEIEKKKLIEKYNELVLFNSYIENDIYEDIKKQAKREKYISEIFSILNIEETKKKNLDKKEKIEILNKKIDEEILKYKKQISYLEEIIPENSKYLKEFQEFQNFCNKIIAYDDTNYEIVKQTFEILSDKLKFKNYISNFEEMFIQEIIDRQKEERFIFEKIGIKNLKTSLNYITANYMDKLSKEAKEIVQYIYDKIKKENYKLEELYNRLNLIVRDIWKESITDVYKFDPEKDYCFICSNNQFIDEKYETIIITKNMINRVDDYHDYQIGFICNYNDNIMYITENEDIMTVENIDDMSKLKTPIQLEQEFINFKICNRIALNGYQTKIEAVYYINDGNIEKYIKAIELANMYNIPLIVLKKDIK